MHNEKYIYILDRPLCRPLGLSQMLTRQLAFGWVALKLIRSHPAFRRRATLGIDIDLNHCIVHSSLALTIMLLIAVSKSSPSALAFAPQSLPNISENSGKRNDHCTHRPEPKHIRQQENRANLYKNSLEGNSFCT
jgi:hypothetical protein